MKNFQNFTPKKYMTSDFQKISDGIYKTKSPYDSNDIFVTSLTFEMEPECYGEENASPSNLTQIPNTKLQTLCEYKRAVQITTAQSVTNIKITCPRFAQGRFCFIN